MKAMIFGLVMVASVAAQAKLSCTVLEKTTGEVYDKAVAQDVKENDEVILLVGTKYYAARYENGNLSVSVTKDGGIHALASAPAQKLFLMDPVADRTFYCEKQ